MDEKTLRGRFEEAKASERKAEKEYVAAKAALREVGAKLEAAKRHREKIEAAAEVLGVDLRGAEDVRG
jgi:hypothetical protein